MKKHLGKLLIIMIVAGIGASFWYADNADQAANEGIEITAKVKGNPDAAVTLVEYSDFQCPACGAAYPAVKELLNLYGDQISFEYRHFPLITIHPFAVPAARAAEAAGQQGKFWEMHDLLFDNQQAWTNAGSPNLLFMKYAEELELDMDTFRRHFGASMIEDHVRGQFAEARALGYSGTPTFILNGEKMQFSTYEDFKTQIEAAIGVTTGSTTPSEAIDVEFDV